MDRGCIYLIFATLFFSSMEVALKSIVNDFHPMQINFTRFFVGGLLLLPFAVRALRRRHIRITASDIREFALLGFIGLFASMMLYQMSILFIPASVVSVLFSCNPVLVLPFAWVILRSEKRPEHIAALALEVAGALFIIDPWKTGL
ncbi:MAG: DMT family transporter, partial [Mailhella sp.]|nr:DMT family transporter [Mailhella sp.]